VGCALEEVPVGYAPEELPLGYAPKVKGSMARETYALLAQLTIQWMPNRSVRLPK